MANNKKPNHRSGPKGPARKAITERNAARRRKKWLRKIEKRWALTKAREAEQAGKPKVYTKKRNPGPNNMGHEDRSRHIIRFRDEDEGKVKIIDGLVIAGSNPEGFNQLKEGEACVNFITKSGKPFSPRLREFSFVVPARVE